MKLIQFSTLYSLILDALKEILCIKVVMASIGYFIVREACMYKKKKGVNQ